MASNGQQISREINKIQNIANDEPFDLDILVGEVKDLNKPTGAQTLITSQLGAYLETLKNKSVENIRISGAKAMHYTAKSEAASKNNFFNGFYQNSGFLGLNKSDFDGNSIIFANVLH